MDVLGRPFQSSIMFACKGKSLPQSGAHKRSFTRAGSSLTHNHTELERPARNKRSSFDENPQITDVQRFITSGPGANVIKLFLSVIYGFSYLARVFVIGKLFWSSLTNTLAYHENP